MRNLFLLASCFYFFKITTVHAQNIDSYKRSIDQWEQKRLTFLKSTEGWVNLVGLFWLQPGKNSFGSSTKNDFAFKHQDLPAMAGFFLWANNSVTWFSAKGVQVRIKDSLIREAVVLKEGEQKGPQLVKGSLRWNIVKREDKMGVRLRNLAAPALKQFKKIDRFPTDIIYKIDATLEKTPDNKLMITNVLGQTNAQESPGILRFKINGVSYQLDALDEGEEELFILFGDPTNGKQTYPTGRYLYVPRPDSSGHTIIDFNKAYNPPCAFSVFATCPLPPKQNILPIPILAGEKIYNAAGLH